VDARGCWRYSLSGNYLRFMARQVFGATSNWWDTIGFWAQGRVRERACCKAFEGMAVLAASY